jgi:hypothetical protein
VPSSALGCFGVEWIVGSPAKTNADMSLFVGKKRRRGAKKINYESMWLELRRPDLLQYG